jgi:hypothetical protein
MGADRVVEGTAGLVLGTSVSSRCSGETLGRSETALGPSSALGWLVGVACRAKDRRRGSWRASVGDGVDRLEETWVIVGETAADG